MVVLVLAPEYATPTMGILQTNHLGISDVDCTYEI